jgi:hypothetical protein
MTLAALRAAATGCLHRICGMVISTSLHVENEPRLTAGFSVIAGGRYWW